MKDKYIWRCDMVPQYLRMEEEINAAIKRVLNSGVYILGKEVQEFEKAFATYLNVKYAVGVANGTDALILAMKVIVIGPGDEVITTPFSAIPTLSAIVATGATPVFVDIDPETYLLDLNKIEKEITPRTKAVIPVHIFGNVLDISKLRELLPKRVKIIEDACQAHGSNLGEIKAGAMGELAAFSFYPTKNVGGYGDGGAIVTNDKNLAIKMKLMRMYGMTDKDHIVIHGINSRLDEIQASILKIKLSYLDKMNAERNEVAQRYFKGIENKLVSFQKVPKDVFHNYHVFTITYHGNREKFVNYLEEKNIQTNIYYLMPLSAQEANKDISFRAGELSAVREVCDHVLSLPMYAELKKETQDYIIKTINGYKEPTR